MSFVSARAIGTGTVSFGLVSIPVKIYTTNKTSSHVSFNMVHAGCGSRLKQQYHCPVDNVVVPRSDMAKGYEFRKDHYVIFTKEELKAVESVSNNAIELAEFVPGDQVDPLYFDKAYYLGPDSGGERAYRLLNEAMRSTGLVGLARYSARGKQHIVLVRPHGENGLVLHQLRYTEELRPFSEVPIEDDSEVQDSELQLAIQIVQQIATDQFEPQKYKDETKEKVLELIQKKIDGQEITQTQEAPQAQIIDLMDALKASLGVDSGTAKPTKAAKIGKRPAKKTKRKKA